MSVVPAWTLPHRGPMVSVVMKFLRLLEIGVKKLLGGIRRNEFLDTNILGDLGRRLPVFSPRAFGERCPSNILSKIDGNDLDQV